MPKMKRCVAYRVVPGLRHAWVPCRLRAERESLFCKRHADALQGVFLGFCVHGFPERVLAGQANVITAKQEAAKG